MSVAMSLVLGVLFAIVATVVLFVLVIPKKQNGHLDHFFQMLHNLFNLHTLYIEKILQVLYVLATCLCVFIGFFLLFGQVHYYYYSASTALYGVALLILGPIAARLLYELLMLGILQVKNTMEINRKLSCFAPGKEETNQENPTTEFSSGIQGDAEAAACEEIAPEEPAPMVQCTVCGSWYRGNRSACPTCGTQN